MTTRKKTNNKRTRPMTISSETGEVVKKGSEVDKAGTVTMQVSTGYEKRKLKKMRADAQKALAVYSDSEELAAYFTDLLSDINDLLGEKPVDSETMLETWETGEPERVRRELANDFSEEVDEQAENSIMGVQKPELDEPPKYVKTFYNRDVPVERDDEKDLGMPIRKG